MSLASESTARQGFRAADLALVGSGAAFLVVCSLVAVPIGPSGAPITLQTFAVLMLGAVLGSRKGALAVLLYLAVGFAGLPVFAEGTGGPATFAKVTLGYLLAFPVGAWLTGFVVERLGARAGSRAGARRPALRRTVGLGAVVLLGSVLGTVVIYAVGVPVLAARLGMSLAEGLAINMAFLPVDLLKIALVTMVAPAVHRAFPDLLNRPAAMG
ncbi:biotin transporter BioY [Actinotalea sp.]|uniref:biotin transporter BioY n=1 Tax=Actinotalea sp. TaxID=1872145 RepID=UPI003563BEDD